MENIAKPITVAREDFINDLVKLINSAQLPLCVVEYVLKDTLNEVHTVSVKQAQEDRGKYEETVRAQQSDKSQNKVKASK